jgi:hypothetical protein
MGNFISYTANNEISKNTTNNGTEHIQIKEKKYYGFKNKNMFIMFLGSCQT